MHSVDSTKIKSEEGPKHNVAAIHQRDAISVLSNVLKDFNSLISAKRSDSEAFKIFENRFAALVSKFNSHGSKLSLPEPILTFLLLHSANLCDNQRISILASVSSNLKLDLTDVKTSKTYGEVVSSIKFESVASILRQCEKDRAQSSCHSLRAHSGNPTHGGGRSSRGRGKGGRGGGGGRNKKMSASKVRQVKMKSQCHYCSTKGLTRFGHWATDHNPDGSLSPNLPSLEQMPMDAQSANAQP